MRSFDLEIWPEPSAEERAAIEQAIAGMLRETEERAWWQAGVDEAISAVDPLLEP